MLSDGDTQTFEEARPKLLGLAYRMLGSLADAEDAVQDAFVKWADADRGEIKNPASWLTTVCTRRCLDLMRSANNSRVSYVGAWLPEPIQKPVENDAESNFALASSLETAFLLMLERLTPKERAAYLLHDIFDVSYREIAEVLAVRESACRKLVSRAKTNIGRTRSRHVTPVKAQEQLLAAFKTAVTTGSTARLSSLLSDDVRLTADGGGKVPTLMEILCGPTEIVSFLTDALSQFWASYDWRAVDINGQRGLILTCLDAIEATVSFAYDESGKATDIYVVRNPDKLSHLSERPIE